MEIAESIPIWLHTLRPLGVAMAGQRCVLRSRINAPSSNRRRHGSPKPGIPVRVGVGLPRARRPKDRASLF